jgi:hypothetical protein
MDPGDQFRGAVRSAVNAARAAVDDLDDEAARLTAASDLVTLLEQLYNGVTDWRALMAYRQYTQGGGVGRQEIARRTGRSPQRADQIINAGRKLAERGDDTSHRGA